MNVNWGLTLVTQTQNAQTLLVVIFAPVTLDTLETDYLATVSCEWFCLIQDIMDIRSTLIVSRKHNLTRTFAIMNLFAL